MSGVQERANEELSKLTRLEIVDWSPEGCRLLVDSHAKTMKLLLMFALTDVDGHSRGPSLSDFGWASIDEAVEWCVERFSTGTLDPTRLKERDRSFYLFNNARFWCAQKVGTVHYRRVAAGAGGTVRLPEYGELPAPLRDEEAEAREELRCRELVATAGALATLGLRTCAPLVGYWLGATYKWRQTMFGDATWPERTESIDDGTSPKERSLRIADALFRHLVILLEFVEEPPTRESRALDLLVAALLTGCSDEAPYRRKKGALPPPLDSVGAHELSAALREGVSGWVRQTLAYVESHASDEPLRVHYVRHVALRSTILDRYRITDGDLRAEIVRVTKNEARS